jgi:hypothetical protein
VTKPRKLKGETEPTMLNPLEAGELVRVVFDAGGRKDREAVGVFVSHDDQHLGSMSKLVLSFRPKAGTSVIERRHIRAAYRCPEGTPVVLPRIYRPEATA